MNLAILEELKAIAKRIFEKLAITPGTYTAAELAKEKDSNGNHIMMSWSDVINELYCTENPVVQVGTFKCTFAPQQIFRYVWYFEKLAGVRDKEKVRFTKMKETEERPFGEAVVPIGIGGRKIPIPCKAVLRTHEELFGVDNVFVRTGGGNAPTAKEICLEAVHLKQVTSPIGTIKIRGSPELSVTRTGIKYKYKKKR